MRFLALTIIVDNEIPSYKEGIMKEIGDWFISNGYYYDKILDRTTRPEGIYFFRTNTKEIKLTKEECERFLERYRERNVKYKLTSLEDAFELDFISE